MKTASDFFFNNLKENPKKIIEWAEAEIREYKKLIDLIKNNKNE